MDRLIEAFTKPMHLMTMIDFIIVISIFLVVAFSVVESVKYFNDVETD